MADLVLARLVVDPSGVVSGVEETGAELSKGQKQLGTFGKAQKSLAGNTSLLVNKMFSLKGALLGIGKAFGIAGIVLSLGLALKTLITSLITSTQWFKAAKRSVVDWWMSLTQGETALGRLTRRMKEFGGAGPSLGVIKRLRELTERSKELRLELKEIERGARQLTPGGAGGILGLSAAKEAFKPIPGKETLATATGFDLERTVLETDILIREAERMGVSFEDLAKVIEGLSRGPAFTPGEAITGLPAEDFFKRLGIPTPEQFDAQFRVIRENIKFLGSPEAQEAMGLTTFLRGLRNVSADFQKLGFTAPQALDLIESAMGSLTTVLANFGLSSERIVEILKEMGRVMEEISTETDLTPLQEQFLALEATVTRGQAIFQAFQVVTQSLANTIADSFLEGGVKFRDAIGQMLKDLARLMITYAVMSVALGILAATGYGALFLVGTPSQFFAAAAAFAGVAALAGAAGIALAGRGGAGEEGGGSRSVLSPATITPVAGAFPNVVVNIEGSLLGTDPNELARDIAEIILTNQSDGGS